MVDEAKQIYSAELISDIEIFVLHEDKPFVENMPIGVRIENIWR